MKHPGRYSVFSPFRQLPRFEIEFASKADPARGRAPRRVMLVLGSRVGRTSANRIVCLRSRLPSPLPPLTAVRTKLGSFVLEVEILRFYLLTVSSRIRNWVRSCRKAKISRRIVHFGQGSNRKTQPEPRTQLKTLKLKVGSFVLKGRVVFAFRRSGLRSSRPSLCSLAR